MTPLSEGKRKKREQALADAVENLLAITQHTEFSHSLVRYEKTCRICRYRKQAKKALLEFTKEKP